MSADLYENQCELNTGIKKIGINIKKDGWERKNSDYFKRRMQMLENLWGEFQFNHDRFLREEEDKNHPYFTSDLYNITFQCCKEVKELILQQHQELTSRTSATPPVQMPSKSSRQEGGVSGSTVQEQEVMETEDKLSLENVSPQQQQDALKLDTVRNDKVEEMLRKQYANFKAFMRATANIQVEFITEKWEFQDALQILQARWSAIDNLHWELESELNGAHDPIYTERYARFESQYMDLKKALNTKMWSSAYREKTTPKLDIPTFNGNYNKWISFRDLFLEAIHNNPSVSHAQKMQFLKGKLQGEAERLIQHLPISSENYIVCWDILNHRYNNTRRLVAAHLATLFGLPNIQQPPVRQIKKLHDVTWECLHAMDNLGVDRDTILVYLLSQKLDAETNMDYIESLKNSRELPTLKEFLEYLESKFTSMEASRRKSENSQKKQSSSQTNNNSHNNKRITKAFYVSTFTCPLCNDEHGLYKCEKFLDMPSETKLSTVRKLNVCTNCLFSHNGNKCTSTKWCRKCSAQHNTLLHETYAKNRGENHQIPPKCHLNKW